jgi:hypothetical protein
MTRTLLIITAAVPLIAIGIAAYPVVYGLVRSR